MGRKEKYIDKPLKEKNLSSALEKLSDTSIISPKESFPKAMYRGELPIGDIVLDCAVLDDGTRILSTASLLKSLGRKTRGTREEDPKIIMPDQKVIKLPPFLSSKLLEPFIGSEIIELINPIEFMDGNFKKKGYKAELLPMVCEVWLSANDEGILKPNQASTVKRAQLLVRSLAKVGIIALIDEATGYQHTRKHYDLRILLEKYINEGITKWMERFPPEFFNQLDKLFQREKTTSRTRPKFYGKFINKYIYEPIENGYVKDELNKLNITDEGKRRARFHQWLSDFGLNQLTLQIGRVMGIMETTNTYKIFKDRVKRQKALSIQPELFKDLED